MKLKHITGSTLIAGVIFIITCSQVFSEIVADTPASSVSGSTEPMAFRKIMRDMGENMQTIADGISREDWDQVEKTAPQIADHPQPPLNEKLRILSFAGTDVSTFKGYDGKTHEAARALEDSAAREDGFAVIADYAMLQNTCLICHQRFRKSFQEYFYGKR